MLQQEIGVSEMYHPPPLFFHQVSLMLLGREEHTMPTDWSRVKGSGEGLGELRPLFLESIVRTTVSLTKVKAQTDVIK